MRKFIIEIECDNAAFDDFYAEVGCCLELVTGAVRLGAESGPITDTNGNRVGSFKTVED